jgi:hypothetical protein
MKVSGQLYAPAALPPGKEPLVPTAQEAGVGPRAVLDVLVKRKIPSPRRESNPRNPIAQPVAQRYTDYHGSSYVFMLGFFFLITASR